MKAVVRRKYGKPDIISVEEREVRSPGKDEVVVKVHVATVNRTDCANLTAKPFIMRFVLGLLKPRKIILGTDFAGTVFLRGDNVKVFEKGDNVFGFIDTGAESHAEYVTVNKRDLFSMPEGINFKQAAASLEGAHYAYATIQKVNLQPGQSVLINGATGAIGSALLQFVKEYDVDLTATSDTKNMELIKSLGADVVIDYTKDDFTKAQEAYDFIFDTVGKISFGECKPLLKDKGVYISSELGRFAQNVFYPFLTLWANKKVIFPIPVSYTHLTLPTICSV